MKSIHTSFILSSSISRSGRTASDASFSLLRKRSHYACKVSSGLCCSPKLRKHNICFPMQVFTSVRIDVNNILLVFTSVLYFYRHHESETPSSTLPLVPKG